MEKTQGRFAHFLTNTDIQFAFGLVAIIFIMIVPMPAIFLDLFLCVSITSGVLILLVSIYVRESLEFSTFPTILLVTTLFRLSLNVATTRSILMDGATGNVSQLIQSFGNFVVGGNYFIGFVIFTILVIVNFIVITKGSGRVAEVSARFTLDAMPGKQMAIDAELNAGVIDRTEAKERRKKIEQEADFYGAMDGASKFVRGDAIAGIIIAVINIVVGLLIGVLSYNMSFFDAASKFTLLTVGDGLLSQIPSLLISTAAGIVVTRASKKVGLSNLLSEQIFGQVKAIFICAGLCLVLAVLPGLPTFPFLLFGSILLFVGRAFKKTQDEKQEQEKEDIKSSEEEETQSIDAMMHIDAISLEVGVGLIPLVDGKQNGEVLDRIVSARKQFAQELGLAVPMVMVKDNVQLQPGEYRILLKGNPVAKGSLMIDYFLAMDPGFVTEPIEGHKTKEPAYGLDAVWIKSSAKDEASFQGYTVVNCATVIVTHLSKVIEENAAEFMGRSEVYRIVEKVREESPKLIEEILAADKLNVGDLAKVFQNLLKEGVSVRDHYTILEAIADHVRTIKNPDVLTRYVRKALSRSLVQKYLDENNTIEVMTLERSLEDILVSNLVQNDDGSTALNLDPEIAHGLLTKVTEAMEKVAANGTNPILLCGSMIRWDLRQLIGRFIPGLHLLAFDEIPSGVKTHSLESIGI